MYRMKIAMSQNGRGSRDVHNMSFLVAPTGAFTRAGAATFVLALANALANVMFNTTHFMRATFTQLDANGKAVPHTSVSIPLSLTGVNEFDEDDGAANEQVCLAIEKAADPGKAGVSYLRHCLSAIEYAAYLNDGTIPARFTVAPIGSVGAGNTLVENITAAFDDGNFVPHLPSIVIDGDTVERPVLSWGITDFRLVQVTKIRRPALSAAAHGAQRVLDGIWRQIKRLWGSFVEGTWPADIVELGVSLIASYWAYWNGLATAERALVIVRALPAFA